MCSHDHLFQNYLFNIEHFQYFQSQVATPVRYEKRVFMWDLCDSKITAVERLQRVVQSTKTTDEHTSQWLQCTFTYIHTEEQRSSLNPWWERGAPFFTLPSAPEESLHATGWKCVFHSSSTVNICLSRVPHIMYSLQHYETRIKRLLLAHRDVIVFH